MKFLVNKLMTALEARRFVQFLALALAVSIGLESVAVWRLFDLSRAHLAANDPRTLQNRSETAFYFAPLTVTAGSETSMVEIVNYLQDLSYAETSDEIKGSYFVDGRKLFISSRIPEIYPNTSLEFNRNRIVSIVVNHSRVKTADLEPLPLQNLVDYIQPEVLKPNLRTRRTVLVPGSLPQLIVDAVISTEDKNFFQTQGVDWLSVSLRPILSGGGQGGSSISQQLIKNNVIEGASNEFWNLGLGTLGRRAARLEQKLAEIPMALEVNRTMTKDEILAAYLSMNYMGTVAGIDLQGFAVASQEFFGRSIFEIADLSNPSEVAFAATLAGMIQAPGSYLKFVQNGEVCNSEERHCKNLVNRRNAVLDLMSANMPDNYHPELVRSAKLQPLGIQFASKRRVNRPLQAESRNFASYAATTGIPSELQELRSESGHVQVVTTLDVQLQRVAVDAVTAAKVRIQREVDRVIDQQRRANNVGFLELERTCAARSGQQSAECQSLFNVQVSLIAADAQTGGILAMTTGVAPSASRSPGSIIKPFYYLKAIEAGMFKGQPFTAATVIDPKTDAVLLSDYCTEDSNLGGRGTVRSQLANSWNLGACLAAQSSGIPTDFVGSITGSRPERTLMSAIGGTRGSEITLPNIVQAYTVFPNNGKLIRLTAYKNASQIDSSGVRDISLSKPTSQPVTDPAATFVTTQLMRSVVTEGTASNFQSASGIRSESIAGKSGSGMVADLWWVSFTPRIVVGVWVGMPNNLPELRLSQGFSGSRTSGPIAAEFMRTIARVRPDLVGGEFRLPDGTENNIVRIPGCRAGSDLEIEYFIRGREPKSCN